VPGLTLYLRQAPFPGEASIRKLVEKGRLRLDLTFEPLEGEKTSNLFLDGTLVQLRERNGQVWSERTMTGIGAIANFDLELSETKCAVAHRSLFGENDLEIYVDLRFRDPTTRELKRESRTIFLSKIPGVPKRVKLKYFDSTTEAYVDVPPRMVLSGKAARRGVAAKPALIATSSGLQSTTSFLRPVGKISAAQTVANYRPSGANFNRLVLLGTLFPNKEDKEKSLPVINNLSAPIWKDRKDPKLYWYLPEFSLMRPLPGTSASSSPFQFRFQREGTGLDGSPVLSGEIVLTLKRGQSNATQQAVETMKADAILRSLPLLDTSYRLRLPYLDQQSTEARHTDLLPQEIIESAEDDSVQLLFSLTNQWIKAAYGAFSIENYQAEPPSLLLDYTFVGYRRERIQQYQLAAGTKISHVAGRKGAENPYPAAVEIDPATGSVHGPAGIHQPGPPPPRRRDVARPLKLSMTTIQQPMNRLNVGTLTTINQDHLAQASRLVERFIGCSKEIGFVFPCTEFAAYYSERVTGQPVDTVIGCREPYALGTFAPSFYTELKDLEDPDYRVLASTQSSGRFLVVPTRYTIGRKWDEDQGLYRPFALFHTTVDAANDNNTVGRFDAYLEPDVSALKLQELENRLAKDFAPNPILDFPTGVEGEIDCSFSEPTQAESTIACVEAGVGFNFGIRLALVDILIFVHRLKTGLVMGNCRLTLPDEQIFQSKLVINPGHLTGPWREGPVTLTAVDGVTKLRNQVSNTVSISEVRWKAADGTMRVTPVAEEMAPGESHDLSEVDPERLADASVVVTEQFLPAGTSIEETNIYLDDIEQQVVLLPGYDLESEGINRIQVEARLEGDATVRTGQLLPGDTLLEIFLQIPFLRYLSSCRIEYRTTTFSAPGGTAPVISDWQPATVGQVITIPKPT
jgi:hypothetical protein